MDESHSDCSRLLSLAVHELRTPITVAAGYVRMLLRHHGNDLTDAQRKLLEEAEKSSARLSGLIAQLSDLANLQAGTAGLQRRDLVMGPLVVEVAGRVHEGADRGVRLELRGATTPATVTGDRDRLRTALESLLIATLREHGQPAQVLVECSVQPLDGHPSFVVVIGTRDEGRDDLAPGPENWGPFDEWRGGVGFSLPTTRLVIEAHGGQVWSHRGGRARAATAVSLPLKELNG
jgi:signal transduction histidine kinase